MVFVFLMPQDANAVDITDIGDLNIKETKVITVSDLSPGRKYYWREEKVSSAIPTTNYTRVFVDCYIADENGAIQNNLGPFTLPGYYRLKLYNASATASGRCEDTAA